MHSLASIWKKVSRVLDVVSCEDEASKIFIISLLCIETGLVTDFFSRGTALND